MQENNATINRITKYWQDRPLRSILVLALIVRLIAAVFSQAYGIHDDHFLIIEAAQSWVDGTDYDDWLPSTQRAVSYRFSDYSFDYLQENNVPSEIIEEITILNRHGYYHETDFMSDIEKHLGVSPALQYMDIIIKSAQLGAVPDGHSFFYVGVHYLILKAFQIVGISDPKTKILLVRLLHALFSLLVIFWGFKISLKYSNLRSAREVGLLLAIAWFMPFLSVRNSIEIACIPFLLFGIWYLLKDTPREKIFLVSVIAGFVMTIAFSVKFECAIFIGGVGLALLFHQRWKESLGFALGVVISILIIQGGIDMLAWGYPFAELKEYVFCNLRHTGYHAHNAYGMYLLVLAGIMIPPFGLFYFFGMLRGSKKYFLLFLPVVLFFAFHTYWPNKQELYIFPIIPAYIILGVMAWNDFAGSSRFWSKNKKLLKSFYVFFWVVNIIMLTIFTSFYSKNARVESMYYFYDKPEVKNILLEESYRDDVVFMPNFYTGRWLNKYRLANSKDTSKLWSYQRKTSHTKMIKSYKYFRHNPQEELPEYILFINETRIKERVVHAQKYFPKLVADTVIYPSLGDNLFQGLNPMNKNVPIYIYKTNI